MERMAFFHSELVCQIDGDFSAYVNEVTEKVRLSNSINS